jgi:hypothetical protein
MPWRAGLEWLKFATGGHPGNEIKPRLCPFVASDSVSDQPDFVETKMTTPMAAPRAPGRTPHTALVAMGMAWALIGNAFAEPAPVAPGLWEVQMLALFQPDPQPGVAHWPGLPGKARARTYRICMDAPRARAPMSMNPVPAGAQRVSDEMTVMARDTRAPATDTHPAASGEWLYRRLSEREFEGSQSLAGDAGIEMTLQYRSVFVQRDCAGLAPTPMSKFGEP